MLILDDDYIQNTLYVGVLFLFLFVVAVEITSHLAPDK